jgi:predicted Zn-dependent protease with MMP-like domain
MTLDEMWDLIHAILAELPEEFQGRLQYTVITVDDGPPGNLLGLYEGVPESTGPYAHLDTITLYKRALERQARSPEELRLLVRETLLHEIGHHFGLNEDEVGRASYPEAPPPLP